MHRAPVPLELSRPGPTGHQHSTSRARAARLTLAVLACGPLMLQHDAELLGTDTLVRASLAVLFASAAALRQPGRGVPLVLGTVATMAWTGLELWWSAAHPMRGLFIMLSGIAAVAVLWPSRKSPHRDGEVAPYVPMGFSLALGLQVALFGGADGLLASSFLTAAYLVVPLAQLVRAQQRRAWLVGAGLAACLPFADSAAASAGSDLPLSGLGLVSPLLVLVHLRLSTPGRTLPSPDGLGNALFARPSRVLVASFLGLCIVGTVLLRLPAAGTAELSWLDAAFTATSSVCVTGLIVVDTPHALTGFGQVVVLLLIQLGGLGIMALSAATVVALGRRLPLSYERATADIIGAKGGGDIARALRLIFRATFIAEAACAVLLFGGFVASGDGVGTAAWRAIFTAVSAFCNAGFALQTDSLAPYADNPFILIVVAVTVVAGGLGPVVLFGLWPSRRQRRPIQVRIVLWATAVLLLVPAVFFSLLEWNNALQGLDPIDRVVNAAFQSVTLRTAGFNTVELTELQPATWTIMLGAMFIGGSPGSTAGGIKTTTAAIFVLLVVSVIRRQPHVRVFDRRISRESVTRASATIALAAAGALVALILMQLTQSLPLDVVVFEVVSALATVGLSMGGTSQLDEVGRVVVMLCMFAGRVGPLTLFSFFSRRVTARSTRALPEEPVATA